MPSEKLPVEQEWDEWKQHPCTRKLREWAGMKKQDLMEQWASGHFSGAFDVEMIVKNAGATGACSIHEAIVELDYQQIVMETVDEEPIRTDTSGAGSAS